jgi:hypothetical protein
MLCDCGHESPHYAIRLTPAGPRTCCRPCRSPRLRPQSVANPFADLTLEHVHDDHGAPLRVTSLRRLQQAEQRHRFRSLVANTREAEFDKPPQTRVGDLFEQTTEAGGWLYPEIAEQQIREMRESGEIGEDGGGAGSEDGTIG